MLASSIELGSASHRKTIESDVHPPHPPPLPPTRSGALRGAAPAGALRPSAQSAPRQANAIGLKPNARPSLTARRADRQGAGDPQDPTSAGESQRQAMPSQRKGCKGRPAPKAQNLGRTIKARAKINRQSAAERKRMRARACS